MISTIEEARTFRVKIEAAAANLPDADALHSIDLFPIWRGDRDYQAGDRCRFEGTLYRCYNAITANPTWKPDVTAAHWEVVRPEQTGTLEDPITAAAGMRYYKGLYYTEGDAVYLCTRDDTNGAGTILHYLPSQLINIYFEADRNISN